MSKFILESHKLSKNQVKLAHIFCNTDYSKYDKRIGNEKDKEKLMNTLPKLGFEIDFHDNLDQINCLKKLKEIAVDHGKKASVILIIFLSHGSLNEVKMTDKTTITIKQIAESFNIENSSYAGKPKIFLFQMCQGSQSPNPLICDTAQKTTKIENILSNINQPLPDHMNKSSKKTSNQSDNTGFEEVEDSSSPVPSGSDMFMGFASSPGFVSYRSKKYGSRFIQTLTTIINDEIDLSTGTPQKIDFISLMTKVAAEVAHMSGKTWPSRLGIQIEKNENSETDSEEIRMQMPWYSSTLTKKLEFEIPLPE